MTVQFIEIAGEKMVVMPMADYDRLIAQAENRYDIAMAANAQQRRDGGEEYLPVEMVDRLLAGEAPLRIWRKHRQLTQQELADRIGTTHVNLSLMERGKREGSVALWRRLARELDTNVEDIWPEAELTE